MKLALLLPILLLGWSSLEVVSSSENIPCSTVEVTLTQGKIKGSKTDLVDGGFFYGFKNIPFAEPPVGSRRLKEPVRAGPWSGTRDGSVDPPPCPQLDKLGLFKGEIKTVGEEDCLYLNVYTPKVFPLPRFESFLPVMVWIHGGGFTSGSIREYRPDPLLSKDVVVVTIQYRLGALGFLSTDDSVIPGNLGMKDQVMALKWVQQNIFRFGGNNTKVTIFGEGAGGMSVHLHMLSPMSKGLFHQVIAQSGTAIMPGLIRMNPRETAIAVGQKLHCEGVDPDEFNSQALYDCLQDIPAENLVEIAQSFAEFFVTPQVMLPSIDGVFLPDHPLKLLKEDRYNLVKFMAGVAKDEGSLFVTPMLSNRSMIDALVANFTTVGPVLLNLESDNDRKVYVAERIFYHYLQDINITKENADQAVKMFSDLMFNYPLVTSAFKHDWQARPWSSPWRPRAPKIYLYEFHHQGRVSFMDIFNISSRDWVCHGDDLLYLFDLPALNISLTSRKDLFMRDIMVSLWTNFAHTGNPTPDSSMGFKWLSDSGDLKVMILTTSPYMQNFFGLKNYEFWENLRMKRNRSSFPGNFCPGKL